MKSILSQSKGFTLLESMMALFVLAIGLLGLAQLFTLAITQNSFARQNSMEISVAVDELEDLKNQYNNYLRTGATPADLTTGAHGPVTKMVAGASGGTQGSWQYRVSWTVTNTSGVATSKERLITVTVDPVNPNVKQNKTIQLSSYLTP